MARDTTTNTKEVWKEREKLLDLVVKGVSLIKSLMHSKCIMAVLFETIRMTLKEWSKLFGPCIITPSQLTQFHNMTVVQYDRNHGASTSEL